MKSAFLGYQKIFILTLKNLQITKYINILIGTTRVYINPRFFDKITFLFYITQTYFII